MMAQVWYLPLDGEEPLASLDSLEGIRRMKVVAARYDVVLSGASLGSDDSHGGTTRQTRGNAVAAAQRTREQKREVNVVVVVIVVDRQAGWR